LVAIATTVGEVRVATLVIVVRGLMVVKDVSVTTSTLTRVVVETVDVSIVTVVVPKLRTRVELVVAVAVAVGVVAKHEQAEETILSARATS